MFRSKWESFTQSLYHKLARLKRNKHISFGLPLIIFVVGGSFVLEEFAKIRYEFKKVNPYNLPEPETPRSSVKPEEEFKKLQQMDIDNWENIRVSRPWEDGGKQPEKPIISSHPMIKQQAKQQ